MELDRLTLIGPRKRVKPSALERPLDDADDSEHHVGDDEHDYDDGSVLDKDGGRKGAVAPAPRAGLAVHHLSAGILVTLVVFSSPAHVSLLLGWFCKTLL